MKKKIIVTMFISMLLMTGFSSVTALSLKEKTNPINEKNPIVLDRGIITNIKYLGYSDGTACFEVEAECTGSKLFLQYNK